MPHLPIPGFGLGAYPPNHDLLINLRNAGVLQAELRCFAGRPDFASQASNGTPWPVNGNPKYWSNPNINRAPLYLFAERGPDGKYIPVKPSGDDPLHGKIFSHSALSFYASRPSVRIPKLKVVPLSYEESGRLSFPPFETEDPMDFPITEIWSMTDYFADHRFPGTQVLYMENGIPMTCTIEEANAKFPVTWGPVEPSAPSSGGGFTGDQVLAVATFLLTNSANRNAAVPIVTGSGDANAKAAALVALGK